MHELGHLIAACFYSNEKISVRIGSGVKFLYLESKMINLSLCLIPYGGFIAFEENKKKNKRSKLLVYLMGPIFSLMLFLVLAFIYYLSTQEVYLFVGIYNLAYFFISIIPNKDGEDFVQSDGYKILKLLRE